MAKMGGGRVDEDVFSQQLDLTPIEQCIASLIPPETWQGITGAPNDEFTLSHTELNVSTALSPSVITSSSTPSCSLAEVSDSTPTSFISLLTTASDKENVSISVFPQRKATKRSFDQSFNDNLSTIERE